MADKKRLPKESTPHLPGTPEKIRVMASRAERRETLFHPDDGGGLDFERFYAKLMSQLGDDDTELE